MMDTASLEASLSLAIAIGSGITLILALFAVKKLKNRSGNDGWTAIHNFQSIIEPDKQIIMEAAQTEEVDEEDEGDPPVPGFDKNKY